MYRNLNAEQSSEHDPKKKKMSFVDLNVDQRLLSVVIFEI